MHISLNMDCIWVLVFIFYIYPNKTRKTRWVWVWVLVSNTYGYGYGYIAQPAPLPDWEQTYDNSLIVISEYAHFNGYMAVNFALRSNTW